MRITNKLTIITTTLVLSALSLTPAHASAPVTPAADISQSPATVTETVVASESVKLDFPRTIVTTSPAPIAEVAPVPEDPAPVAVSTPVPMPQVSPNRAAVVPAAPTVQSTPVVPVVAPSSGRGATIAAAAYAQLGVAQDCTRLVSNALAAAGINFHGWPAGYLSLGPTVSASEAQAGDLIYYPNGGTGMAHIAVYIGGGKAIHGGWNGGTTAIASAFIGSGATFIRM